MVKRIMFDRLYGKLLFPPLIQDLLDCPGLLRLREVHMSSIPFMSYPSFSSVNRFEHSIGVCHLANLASKAMELTKTEKIELMCASLYHDVATPPFAHVTEELMEEFFGFDHEEYLRSLLTGKTQDLGMEKSQIYKGKSLKLLKVVGSEEGRKLDLDIFRIADMATGGGKLGPLVKGEIDLDNIDNVIRAATAMGIKSSNERNAEMLAQSFVLSKNHVALREGIKCDLENWRQTRFTLYDMIYGDIEDFSLQTMLKSAIKLLMNMDNERKLLDLDWSLTDEELVMNRLMHNENTRDIWERISLFKPFPCLGIFSFSGQGSSSFVKKNMSLMEKLGRDIFGVKNCIANFIIDKRYRDLTYPLTTFLGEEKSHPEKETIENTFLFFFSPQKPHCCKKLHLELASELQLLVPEYINLKLVTRVIDRYPRLADLRLL